MGLLDQIEGAHRKLLHPSGGCHNCPRKRIDFVPATLRQGKILWLGEAPGRKEVEDQEGFVGKSGQFLRQVASEVGIPEPWSFSNTIHCRPPENAKPEGKEIQCCLSQFVLDEIRGYPIVVMVGSTPLTALFPGAQGTHFRGNVAHHPDFPGQRFYNIYHPSYILQYGREHEPIFRKHLARLARIAQGEPPVPWKILHSAASMEALDAMLAGPMISFDAETDRVNSWEVGASTKSFCVTADGLTVVAVHKDDPWFVSALTRIQKFMEQPQKSIIGGNIAFDIEWNESDLGFTARMSGIHDPAVWWYEAGQYQQASLKQLVSEQLDGYRYLVHRPDTVQDVELLLNYNAEDVIYPIHLVRAAVAKVQPATADLVTRVLSPATLVLRKMQTRGLYIRQDYRKQKIEEYADKRRAAVAAWKAEDPEFKPDTYESGKGLHKYLFQIRQLPELGQTKEGAPVVDKAVIKQWIRDGATYLKHLLTIREIDKISGTYLTAYDKHVWPDSRIRPKHWITSTDTSRPSSTDPNVYNIPRASEIRDLFGCPPGHRLVESDFSQIEFRIMVSLARDETGITGYQSGLDAHTMTAITISGNPTPTKAQRSEAKPVNFALIYGGDWPVVQRQARDEFDQDWDEAMCRRFKDAFFSTYTRFPAFHEASKIKLVQNRGWFQSVTGHVFHYDGWDSTETGARNHAFRQALNAEAQGPASNICLYTAVLARRLLDERGFSSVYFVNSVYDSIMTEIPNPKWVPAVLETINEATQQAYSWVKQWFIVPLVIEHSVGESWGSLEEVK